MVWRCRANKLQRYIRILKETTIEAIKLRILKAKELVIKEAEVKPKILIEDDISADSIIRQVV